ncbi:type III pantothenate kinase [Marinobacter salinexigens]|uniref:Type III pantothenate kinase n=1 Tax=Marinobacter salinexigens TaxID=2919747 RepID=A0A5B0V761_9GAMM|nr:type III pantothenate kinase [Marinobacter salinexigens]KAA1170462.1 type III pantothenate kinase [Marinobacter salinexigens]
MKLLVDAGNTRVKWRLSGAAGVVGQGAVLFDEVASIPELANYAQQITSIVVSTVISEERRRQLNDVLLERVKAPVRFYWAETERRGLRNAYEDPARMGADRWHAMYGAWRLCSGGFAVIDAGSAITIDYVDASGMHLGGYILPGVQMMFRSLRTDAARIGFDVNEALTPVPGHDTGECVNHGLAWLSSSVSERIMKDVEFYGLSHVLVTGGDARRLLDLGLSAREIPELVLDGLERIDTEEAGR